MGRDPSHDLSSRSVGQEPARVVMCDASGELLQRDVRERVGKLWWFGHDTGGDLGLRARSSATGSTMRVTVR